MRHIFLCLLLVGSLASAAKKKPGAQPPPPPPPPVKAVDDDAPIPFDDEDSSKDDDKRRDLPTRSEPTRERREETQVEQEEREESLAHLDDPYLGLGGEFLTGMMLLESSKGGVDARFQFGLRVTWEWSRRLLTTELARELFFADLNWSYTGVHDGTKFLFTDTTYHYFTLAPAISYPLGGIKSPFSVYAQLGVGFGLQPSSVTVNSARTEISAARFLFQYGLGLRLRLLENLPFKLSGRLELTRYKRGYLDDTLIGLSLGAIF